jgi:hypothetical protein
MPRSYDALAAADATVPELERQRVVAGPLPQPRHRIPGAGGEDLTA